MSMKRNDKVTYPSVGRTYPCDVKVCLALRLSVIGSLPCTTCDVVGRVKFR